MDGSYLNRWASWVARWLVAGVVVTVGACSWSSAGLGEDGVEPRVPGGRAC